MKQPVPTSRPSSGHYLLTYGIVVLLWLLLCGNLRRDEIIFGLIVSAVVTALDMPRLRIMGGVKLTATAPLALVRFLVVFSVALIRANFDVARHVLAPSLRIRPTVVEVRTGLRSSLGKLLLAHSITLTPGTLSIDLRDDRLLVHWIDSPPDTDTDRATRAIAESFERHISGFLE
jgi:multicomponent Na+:H+ antiporter subunit E